ncbi:flavoprotein [Virgibacillus dokdonensis]|uniref:flavoprotein n=1 Tax=Virgibacillus dokdonensis TaxID=302167 RepID=UPI00098A6B47|nr:flavoprotein [Virgibacillus dokdonensis]
MKDKKIVFGITGSIAAINVTNYIYELLSLYRVEVVLTKSASNFLNPNGLRPLADGVYTDAFDLSSNKVPHVNLVKDADHLVILPASANFLSKMANGVADDLLSLCVLNYSKPIFIGPSMNQTMWENKSTQRNVNSLKEDGHVFINTYASGFEASSGDTVLSEAALPSPNQLMYYLREQENSDLVNS